MQFIGNVRIRLRPLLPLLPIVSGVSISFVSDPVFDCSMAFQLSPLLPAFDVMSVPGVRAFRCGP
eukprot:4731039-Pyramimonas_sp.AAC.1